MLDPVCDSKSSTAALFKRKLTRRKPGLYGLKRVGGYLLSLLALCSVAEAQNSFQPYSAQGYNLVHVTTADFDGVGAKDYVVGMDLDGKVIAFQRPDLIVDPAANNILWEYITAPTFNIMITAAEVDAASAGEEILVPGTDGHLRVISSTGALLSDWAVSADALYCVDAGVNSAGQVRIVTGGVDGKIYVLDANGTQLAGLVPPRAGVVRRAVVGNFDGIGGDEVVTFYKQKNFSGSCYFEVTDLDTLTEPTYWGATSRNTDDVGTALGWTDKQVPHAYDMDGDGDEEVVGHWGVLHPELGAGTQVLSTLVAPGEVLHKKLQYTDIYGETDTGKYLLQQSVPGNFKDGAAYPGAEMLTIYGDDLYLVDYDLNEPASDRFRVRDYGYSHTLYHFTNGARLESRSGGLDKLVLAGPINGDDHFYVADLSNSQWKTDAKTIDGNGVLGTVRTTLDTLETDVDAFNGNVAAAGDPIWFVHYFASFLGWPMTTENIASHVDDVEAAMQVWSDELFGVGYTPQRINWTASFSLKSNGGTQDPDITVEGMEAYFAALAARGLHSCLVIGHGNNIEVTPDELARYFEASVVNGKSYLMARTKELKETDYIDLYKPHMDAVRTKATELGVDPLKIMLCGKGAVFSAMTPTQASTYFPGYNDLLVLGVENSNVTVVDWSFSERVALWLNGDVQGWGSNTIGDNLSANRVVEFGGMRNGHVVLRQMLSQYALGANIFRITSIQNQANPLAGEPGAPAYSNAYRQGIFNFCKIVEAGVYPNSPAQDRVKGVSPVAITLPTPNYTRLLDQSINHDWNLYAPQASDYVINNLACWEAYTDVPDFDLSAIAFNGYRRWDNLLPTSAGGFVAVLPYESRAGAEAQSRWNRAFETDGDTWAEFTTLTDGRDTVSAEILAQRSNLLFYVDGTCFWQVTEELNDSDTYFAVLMDSDTLTPTDRSVDLKLGSATGTWEVYDQFGSQTTPLGTLTNGTDQVAISIPAGAVRLLTLVKNQPPAFSSDPVTEINGDVSQAYSATLADDASDPEGDAMTFSLLMGPAWLSVASDGSLSGTPGSGDVGLNAFTVKVEADGGSDSATLNITVDGTSSNDDFQTDSWSGGSGWSGDWVVTSGSSKPSIELLSGNYSARLRRGNANHSVTRTLTTGIAGGTLNFKWDIDSMDSVNEYGYAEVYDGAWHIVWSMNNNGNGTDADNVADNLVPASVDLSAYGTVTQVRFRCSTNTQNKDYFFVDDVEITN
jgi:hypothetical protein